MARLPIPGTIPENYIANYGTNWVARKAQKPSRRLLLCKYEKIRKRTFGKEEVIAEVGGSIELKPKDGYAEVFNELIRRAGKATFGPAGPDGTKEVRGALVLDLYGSANEVTAENWGMTVTMLRDTAAKLRLRYYVVEIKQSKARRARECCERLGKMLRGLRLGASLSCDASLEEIDENTALL